MLIFEIGNLYTKVSGPDHEIHLLRNILSCYVPGYQHTRAYKQGRWNGKAYFVTKTGTLPTGLLPYAIKKLPLLIEYRTVDKRKVPPLKVLPPFLHGITLRPYQQRAISIACSKKRGVIQAPAGSGKTEVAIGIISSLSYPKTLYLVHQRGLMHQTAERIERRLRCEPGIIGDGIYRQRRITVATIQALWHRIKDPRTALLLRDAQLLIIDECHHASATTWYRIAMKTHAAFRFGLSATPMVANSLRNMKLAAATGPIIVRISEEKLAEHGYLCLPTVRIITVSSPLLPPHISYPVAYERGILKNPVRNVMIEDIARKLASEQRTVLILVEMIDHGKKLAESLNAPFLTGKEPQSVRKKTIESLSKRETSMVIATKIFDEGIDVPIIDAVILAGGGKSYVKCVQRIGRTMRTGKDKKKPVVIDFLDKCHPYLKRHSLERINLYKNKNYPVFFVNDTT